MIGRHRKLEPRLGAAGKAQAPAEQRVRHRPTGRRWRRMTDGRLIRCQDLGPVALALKRIGWQRCPLTAMILVDRGPVDRRTPNMQLCEGAEHTFALVAATPERADEHAGRHGFGGECGEHRMRSDLDERVALQPFQRGEAVGETDGLPSVAAPIDGVVRFRPALRSGCR